MSEVHHKFTYRYNESEIGVDIKIPFEGSVAELANILIQKNNLPFFIEDGKLNDFKEY